MAKVGWRWAVAIALLTVLLRLPALTTPILDVDEAIFATCAQSVVHGDPLYIACLDHQPPGIFWFFAAVFSAVGPYHFIAVHAATLLVVLGAVWLLWRAAYNLGGARAGFFAALLLTIFSTTHINKILSTNAETLGNLLLVAQAYLLLCAPERGRGAWKYLLGAGVLVGLGWAVKIQVGMVALIMGVPFLRHPRQTLQACAGMVIGCALWLLPLWSQDALQAMWSAVFADGTQYAQAGSAWARFAGKIHTHLLPTLAGMAPLLYWGARPLRSDCTVTPRQRDVLRWWLIGATIAALLGGRMYAHYFLLLMPPLALRAGLWLTHSPLAPTYARLQKILLWWCMPFLVVRVFGGALEPVWNRLVQNGTIALPGLSREATYRDIADYIHAHGTPDDRLAVWGFAAPLYPATGLRPFSRYITADAQSGRIPGLPFAATGTVPPIDYASAAWQEYLTALTQNNIWFIDTAPANINDYGAHPIAAYPPLADFVLMHCTLRGTFDRIDVYYCGAPQ